ncbi:hypothetical protein, partial [Candidatus Cyanaurora vandensis]
KTTPAPALVQATLAHEETAPTETDEETNTDPALRPQPPVRRSIQTPAARVPRTAAATENTRGRRTSTSTSNTRTESRRQGNAVGNSGGGASYRDLEEAGAIDPRWAVLLEAKKKLELKV